MARCYRPPGKTGFLKMTASKRTCNSARLLDGKGGHSRDEDKTAALAARKTDLNLTQLWAREVHLPSFCVRGPASRRSPEVGFAAFQLDPWGSLSPGALNHWISVHFERNHEAHTHSFSADYLALSARRLRADCAHTPLRCFLREVRGWYRFMRCIRPCRNSSMAARPRVHLPNDVHQTLQIC